jgi:hypothetical protein
MGSNQSVVFTTNEGSMKSFIPSIVHKVFDLAIDILHTVQYVFCVRRTSHVDCSLILRLNWYSHNILLSRYGGGRGGGREGEGIGSQMGRELYKDEGLC